MLVEKLRGHLNYEVDLMRTGDVLCTKDVRTVSKANRFNVFVSLRVKILRCTQVIIGDMSTYRRGESFQGLVLTTSSSHNFSAKALAREQTLITLCAEVSFTLNVIVIRVRHRNVTLDQ